MTRGAFVISGRARAALAGLLLAVLAACAAPPAAVDSSAGSAAPVADVATDNPAPPVSASRPAERDMMPAAARSPPRIDASCKVDADCVVKDVGNCCGAYPACVNADSPTDPAAVQAACKASGRMAACGFREISACSCEQGSCRARGEPVGGWVDGQTEPVK